MRKVKGTMLVNFIKTIRADKSDVYSAYLNPQDKQIISQNILSSTWYPYDTYKRSFIAVEKVIARGRMELVRGWGKMYGEKIVSEVYKNLIISGDPMSTLKKYKIVFKLFFDFGILEVKEISAKEAQIIINEFDSDFEAFYHLVVGWMEKSLELSGAKNVKSEFILMSWEGDQQTSIKFQWQ